MSSRKEIPFHTQEAQPFSVPTLCVSENPLRTVICSIAPALLTLLGPPLHAWPNSLTPPILLFVQLPPAFAAWLSSWPSSLLAQLRQQIVRTERGISAKEKA